MAPPPTAADAERGEGVTVTQRRHGSSPIGLISPLCLPARRVVNYYRGMGKIDLQPARTARGTATRARIVEAATGLVRAHGVASTSLDAVLAASNTSKSQLYHYFADKDDLVLAVVQRQTECVLAAQETLLRKFNSLAGLRRWRDALVELSRKNDGAGGCPLGSLVPELAEYSPPGREACSPKASNDGRPISLQDSPRCARVAS